MANDLSMSLFCNDVKILQRKRYTVLHTVSLLFPTRLLTSEDEYKWYWHQMIYFPETINTISTMNTMSPTHSLVSS